MIARLVRRVDASLFSPQPSGALGALRLAFFGWLFVWFVREDFTFVSEFPVVFWTPVDLLRVLGLVEQPPVAVVAALQAAWKVSLLLAAVGLFSRTSALFAFGLGAYLLALTHSFHKINHSDAVLVLAMLVFALSRCGDRISVDSLVRRLRVPSRDPAPVSGGEYAWPIRMLQIIWVIVFVLSGLSKLRNGGLDWMFSDNLANIIVKNQVSWSPLLPLGLEVARFGWLCKAAAVGTVVMELAAAFVLVSKLARVVVVPSLLGMQLGIYLLMGDNFTQFMALYLVFVPWPALAAWLRRHAPLRRRIVLYDGGCGLCGRTVSFLRGLDVFDRLDFRDVVGRWPEIHQSYPSLELEACLRDMHVIRDSGRITKGFAAYRSLAAVLPLCWPVLPMLYLPGVAWLGEKLYSTIASGRGTASCALPQA